MLHSSFLMQNQDMNLVLSTDAKPRLKWTPELHQRFVDAIIQLGGTDKVTPKSLMRVMGIPGLTLYHLKSHLQKYRIGKNHPIEASSDSKKEDCKDDQAELVLFSKRTSEETESLHVSRAIQVQAEVQRKLHEQIEVQRHLQLRIEAQGKYLQEVLKKAQETLSGYTSSSMGFEHAKVELSQLVSMVNSGCASPSLSELTEARALSLENLDNQVRSKRHGCSAESSLTSSENSGVKEDKEPRTSNSLSHAGVALPSLDQPWIAGLNDQVLGKRRGITTSEAAGSSKKVPTQLGLYGGLDLNSQYQYQDTNDLGQCTIDLNSIGIE